MDSFEDRFVNVRGVKTRFWQAGSDGSAVILLHGIGCSVLDWQTNVRALASRHRVYALDMLGYGLTEKPSEETYTISQLAQFTLDFLKHRRFIGHTSLASRWGAALYWTVGGPRRNVLPQWCSWRPLELRARVCLSISGWPASHSLVK
jgi:pimeloyl-ACP methyl ester carboxylesterase